MVMATTAAIVATRMMTNNAAPIGLTTPVWINCSSWSVPGQNCSRIENVMRRLMPLPMPRSVICSPSHITKMAPVVSVTTMIKRDQRPGVGMAPGIDSVNSAKV
jgi:hypothetical protein